jgi:hypothetical protein
LHTRSPFFNIQYSKEQVGVINLLENYHYQHLIKMSIDQSHFNNRLYIEISLSQFCHSRIDHVVDKVSFAFYSVIF